MSFRTIAVMACFGAFPALVSCSYLAFMSGLKCSGGLQGVQACAQVLRHLSRVNFCISVPKSQGLRLRDGDQSLYAIRWSAIGQISAQTRVT